MGKLPSSLTNQSISQYLTEYSPYANDVNTAMNTTRLILFPLYTPFMDLESNKKYKEMVMTM